ncbi:hypothetical protein KUV57_11250 [Epibacterium sp. DP7N7-1]|nr:hypothetical protein [Epibacterium sp. DP7N7-1]
MIPLTRAHLKADIQDCAAGAASLFELIDALQERGIDALPRMRSGVGMLSLRFRSGEVSLTRAEAGLTLDGPLSYSVTHHDAILRYLAQAHERGAPQDKILDEAGELALPVQTEAPSFRMSLQFGMRIGKIAERLDEVSDFSLRGLVAGYDGWCHFGESVLRGKLNAPPPEEIEALEEPHRVAALRWTCRLQTLSDPVFEGMVGREPEIALRRQEAFLRHIGKAPSFNLQTMDP